MAELIHALSYTPRAMTMAGPVESSHEVAVNLYCWPCRTVHAFTLVEVEQIVYALGAAEILAYDSGYQDAEDQAERTRPADGPSACLRTALQDAGNPEVFAEHVDQGMECRERSPEAEAPPVAEVQRECTEETWSWEHFTPAQVDPYWIKCTQPLPHAEHKDGTTGLTWLARADRTPPAAGEVR